MNELQIERLLTHLGSIDASLRTLAEYAEMQRIAASGEKVYEVGAFVLSVTSTGDRCAYLYATHPGLQYRVCTVYEERFGELPIVIPPDAKTWDAEVAPSRGGAAQRGYLHEVPPFRVSILPTGKQTDAGLPVHRFNRVLDASDPAARASAAQPAATSDQHFDALPGASAARAAAAAAVRGKFAALVAKHNAPQPASDDERQRAFNNLRTLCGNGDDKRKIVVKFLTGKDSLTEIASGEAHAIRDWVSIAKVGADYVPSAAALSDLQAILQAA